MSSGTPPPPKGSSWTRSCPGLILSRVDSLVARGYLDRQIDPLDRRRLVVVLTRRGETAAAVRAAVDEVEASLAEQAGAPSLGATRRTLASLIDQAAR